MPPYVRDVGSGHADAGVVDSELRSAWKAFCARASAARLVKASLRRERA